MADKLVSVYKCADGTDFPVEWEKPEDAEAAWTWNRQHAPLPATPMEVVITTSGLRASEQAFFDVGLLVPSVFGRPIYPHGFLYNLLRPFTPSEQAAQDEAVLRLFARYGGAGYVWKDYCLPLIQGRIKLIRESGPSPNLATLGDARAYARNLTHVAGQCVVFLFRGLATFLAEELSEAETLTYELTAGYPNATLDADEALWQLAQVARKAKHFRAALLDEPLDIPAVEAAGSEEFRSAFRQFQEFYGARAQDWQFTSPTWRERPDIPLGFVARFLRDETPSPRKVLEETARRRQELVAETEARLAGRPEKLAAFRALLAPLECYVPVREGRALWQLILVGSTREALVRIGGRLVGEGRIEAADDILFLNPGALEQSQQLDLRDTVEARRDEWQRWLNKEPPDVIGAVAAPEPAIASAERGVLKGIGASRGQYTGRARVVSRIEDGDRLEPGEILVCVMTSPPWTPLFAVAGAVVTETGSLLSHPSIAAREYGIPCVVGTRDATRAIRDGALITVDGAQGTVKLED